MGTCADFVVVRKDVGYFAYNRATWDISYKWYDGDRTQAGNVHLDGNDLVYRFFKTYGKSLGIFYDDKEDHLLVPVPKEKLQELIDKHEECFSRIPLMIAECFGVESDKEHEAYYRAIIDPYNVLDDMQSLLERFDWNNKELHYYWTPT